MAVKKTKAKPKASQKKEVIIKKPNGRPSDYRPEYDKKIIEVMQEGASLVEFCAEIGVCRDTPYEWAEKHESFSYAFTRARLLCQAWWEKQGRENLSDTFMDGSGKKFNDRLWNKNVSCRFRDDWTDNKPDEEKSDRTLTIRFENGS
jgi:hypothetical protein